MAYYLTRRRHKDEKVSQQSIMTKWSTNIMINKLLYPIAVDYVVITIIIISNNYVAMTCVVIIMLETIYIIIMDDDNIAKT